MAELKKSYTEKERSLALKRALKLAKLFDGQTFDNILNAVEIKPVNQSAFNSACASVGLNEAETAWLWNYLQHCNRSLSDPVPDVMNVDELAAATGW